MRLSQLLQLLKTYPEITISRTVQGSPFHIIFISNKNGVKSLTRRKYYGEDPVITEVDLICIGRSLRLSKGWYESSENKSSQ